MSPAHYAFSRAWRVLLAAGAVLLLAIGLHLLMG